MNNYQKPEEKDNKHYIIKMIIILIIIILMLLTSCSCTSKLWGKIGDFFDNDGNVIIDGGSELEVIRNKDLTFDKKYYKISLSDNKYKLTYSFKNIIPENLTCETSDAKIATCYVENGHVVVIPKKEGKVTITLKTELNDKIYEATTELEITESRKYIKLSSKKGTIDLKKTDRLNFSYYLEGLDGEVKITSSDESVATISVKGNIVTVIAHKTGTAKINLSLEYNGKTYETNFTVKVIESKDENPEVPVKESSKYLLNLLVENGVLSPDFDSKTTKYSINLKADVNKLNFYPEYDKLSKVIYKFNDVLKDSIEALDIPYGTSKVTIIVTNNKNETTTYEITINREKPEASDYYITSPLDEYEMIYSEAHNTRTITFDTNLFVGGVKVINIDGGIRIVSQNDKTMYIDITSDSSEITKISYDGELTGPVSLPIVITAGSAGVANINATMYAFGEKLNSLDVKINIVSKLTLILNANGGLFNDLEKEYKFVLGANDEVDLSIYDKPYKESSESTCKIYKFIGYSKEKADGSPVIYNGNEVIKGSSLTSNLTLYAMYDTKVSDKVYEMPKRVSLVDVPIFKNQDYYDKYHEEKVIYPGSSGKYIAHITNEAKYDITITKIIIEEDNICSTKGCLNMGYIIKHGGDNFFMGGYENNVKQYEILHKNTSNTRKEIDLLDRAITIKPGEAYTEDISFFWEWVDKDDEVDTSIGNIAAGNPLNTIYKLYITFEYITNEEKCN